MISAKNSWKKLGLVITPDKAIPWMSHWAGAACAEALQGSRCRIFMTGRDGQNRSHIGSFELDLDRPTEPFFKTVKEVLAPGTLGAFDENGVSYPFVIQDKADTYLFYVGWMPSLLTPFQNHIGLAMRQADGQFQRVSRAPILERNNDDFLSMGSCCAMIENGRWRLWYTAWTAWTAQSPKPQHDYRIKYAESDDGIHWKRKNTVCIGPRDASEHAIARPSVLKINSTYHMWYCYRGETYRIGYAHSEDGIVWTRRDDLAGIGVSESGWDSQSICYPHVFQQNGDLYMLYCGNDYGREGLGIASLSL